jgi:hypothetical protein
LALFSVGFRQVFDVFRFSRWESNNIRVIHKTPVNNHTYAAQADWGSARINRAVDIEFEVFVIFRLLILKQLNTYLCFGNTWIECQVTAVGHIILTSQCRAIPSPPGQHYGISGWAGQHHPEYHLRHSFVRGNTDNLGHIIQRLHHHRSGIGIGKIVNIYAE